MENKHMKRCSSSMSSEKCKLKQQWWEFPGGPVVRTPRFHCWGPGVLSLVRELRSHKPHGSAKKTNKKQWDTTTHLLKWPKSRTLTTPGAGKQVEQQELSFITGGNAKWYSHFGRQSGNFLIKRSICLPYNPAIVPLGIYPAELKTYAHTKTCTQMSIVVLFIIAKT